MFSDRTRFDLRPNRLAQRLAERRAAGQTLIDLTLSNPTRAGLPEAEGLLAPLAADAARRYDPVPFGLLEARGAVARDFAVRGCPLETDRILLHASTSEAYGFLFKLLCDPGDEVLVPRPGYPLFDFLAGLESVHVRSYALAYDGEWHLDLSAIAAALGPRARETVIITLGTPTNATLGTPEIHTDTIRDNEPICPSPDSLPFFGSGADKNKLTWTLQSPNPLTVVNLLPVTIRWPSSSAANVTAITFGDPL